MKNYFYKGLSLVEMIVAIGILSMTMFGVVLYFVNIWPLQQFAIDSAQAQYKASQTVTSLVSLFRNMRQSDAGEYALKLADPTEVIFFADQDEDGDIERVRIFLDGTNLRMGIIDPVGSPATYPTNQEVVSIFLSDVRNGFEPYPGDVFSFYDNGNSELTGSFSISVVRMIGIDLYVDINPSSSPAATHFQSFASIRNLSEYDRAQ